MTKTCDTCVSFQRDYSDDGYLETGQCTFPLPPFLVREDTGTHKSYTCYFHDWELEDK